MAQKTICSVFALILILLNGQEALAQISSCNLNTTENTKNICDSSNYLVYISESVCETSGGTSCWCILVDNRNREYDGLQVEIVMDNLFRVTWMRDAIQTDYDSNSLELKFIIMPDINRIYLEPYTSLSPIPNVISLKIDDHKVCKTLNRKKRQINLRYQEQFYIQSNNLVTQPQNTQNDYRFLNDCMERRGYTANSEHFCHNDGSDFVIEKRYLTIGERYWCIIINNNNYLFSSANRLRISYSTQNKFLAWTPSDAHIVQNSGDSFTLGGSQTIVAVSKYNGVLPELTTVTIDGQSICNYFQLTETAPLLSRFTSMSYHQPYVSNAFDRFGFPNNLREYNIEEPNQLNDCMQRRNYTDISERFCPNDASDFIIEKRNPPRGGQYWCININNEKNKLSSANQLRISYSYTDYKLAWSPADAKPRNGDSFGLGGGRTVIAISKNTGDLTDLTTVTIDGQSICNYFNPPETTRSSIKKFLRLDKPAVNNSILPAPQYEEQPIESQNISNFNINCGTIPAKVIPLATFSEETRPGDWPWHAAIYKLESKTKRTYACGGTLINRKTVITAAHCIVDTNLVIIPDRLMVALGRYDLSIETSSIQEHKIFDVIPHNLYRSETHENDIGILVLANYVQLTTYVNFICLPESNMNLQNQVGKAVGWGVDESNKAQPKLKEVSMPVIENIMCLSSNREFFGVYLSTTNFCAGYRNNSNVCVGDSGGGLVFEINNRWILGGITSMAVPLRSVDLPCDISQYSLFTDVRKFVNWIKENSL